MDGLDVFHKSNNILNKKYPKMNKNTVFVLKEFTIQLMNK